MLSVDYSKSLFEVDLDTINFHYATYSVSESASMKSVAFSQSFQKAFHRRSELDIQARNYVPCFLDFFISTLPLMHIILGIRKGTVAKLSWI
jgi:hypothetical protein